MNANIELGEELTNFKAFTSDFPPEMKGLAISNSELIRNLHNSFARPEPWVVEETHQTTSSEDIYHFISYLPFGGKIYELDGLKRGPILLEDSYRGDDWLSAVTPHIQKRIEKYSKSEIRFNLMAVVKNRKNTFLKELEELERKKQEIQSNAMDTDSSEPSLIDAHIQEVKQKLALEQEKLDKWKLENIRRKHNYVPFLVNLLKLLAEKGELMPLIEKSRKTSKKS
eukprot:TRINITY_DN6742_c0_g1_i1.p1 TRINITY_DN6742_c0_g1~~TRINITY_DN6742_c0_g1_i1.p1  ORF type:complete len:226 (+),score=61.69 TRINITY_DN6742_c0_g1_i1:459-1136(+)